MVDELDLALAKALLRQYLDSHPEHDAGDHRVWEAYQLLAKED
jgi:hypothetical protein